MVNDFQFYLYTILAVIILSLLVSYFLKRYMVMPILTLIIMSASAFILPNFYNNLQWQPLLGYAAFLAVLSFVITMSMWVVNRNRRRAAEERRVPKETIEEAERKKEI